MGIEPTLNLPSHPSLPDAVLVLADSVVAFDLAFDRLLLIVNAHINGDEQEARARAEVRLDQLQAHLTTPLSAQTTYSEGSPSTKLWPTWQMVSSSARLSLRQ